ncbi:MarR family winged helix-turn-helix transcriptional regulator [Novosphingobium cyanobacteriorum]|uniref:MarR family winged helix-turn-helix transcriptional regulator n=1 Tax=Novosphingobium cyanobacteriorum TaxID=3024215 RepID=A0ABT6CN46_9SPHN|nr:MarR family winged helix-turn-helix transcriptional regulator [Novosphingobium cyanobacteriorum]MDF8333752.1 MarR family winged helix-turn-helix transcriptional regulator [Novosphingobium cyanobacteriorum]
MKDSPLPPATTAELEEQLSYLVNRLSHHGQASIGAMLKPHRANLVVLRTLSMLHIEDGLTINEIAERTFCEQSKASRTVDAMVQSGLVERHTPDCDLRRREVVLTAQGRALLHECWPEMERFHAQLVVGISAEDLAVTRRVLKAMTANLRP